MKLAVIGLGQCGCNIADMFYDVSERPIYVGEGGNVRGRIKDHEDKFWFKRPIVESASWIEIKDGKLRKQIETLLIKFGGTI